MTSNIESPVVTDTCNPLEEQTWIVAHTDTAIMVIGRTVEEVRAECAEIFDDSDYDWDDLDFDTIIDGVEMSVATPRLAAYVNEHGGCIRWTMNEDGELDLHPDDIEDEEWRQCA
jgi:hypothetical protein